MQFGFHDLSLGVRLGTLALMTGSSCIFCAMARGEIDVEMIAADDHGFVIRPLESSAEMHLLVLSRRHIESVDSLTVHDQALWSALLRLAQQAVRIAGLDVGATGYQVVTNAGRHAERAYPHLHLHVLGGTPFRL